MAPELKKRGWFVNVSSRLPNGRKSGLGFCLVMDKKDKWLNHKKYGLTKFTCVNALLLVLNSLLEKDSTLAMNLDRWLSAIDAVNYENDKLLVYGRGYPAMPKIANKIIRKMNLTYNAGLNLV